MKIVVAPDSFKGSMSASEICSVVKKGIENVMPTAQVKEIPLADGGEGTMDNLVYSTNGTTRQVEVVGPIGKKITASYGILGDQETVIIEMAQASGLPILRPAERDPLHATTFGTGQLIKDALDQGYRKFIIGLGGSATNDAGAGMLRALGVTFYDKDHGPLPEGGGALNDLAFFDDSKLDQRLKEATFVVASDVTNKLCGPEGASAIFGPQKGATPEMVTILDRGLNRFAEVVLQQKGMDMRDVVGGGAAGGLGSAIVTFLHAEVKSGIHVVMDTVNFEEEIRGADLIITGEGRLDSQTLSGKVISGVCKVAKKYQVPVIALCGSLELEAKRFEELGLQSAFSIVSGPCDLAEAMEKAPHLIIERVEAIMRVIRMYSYKDN